MWQDYEISIFHHTKAIGLSWVQVRTLLEKNTNIVWKFHTKDQFIQEIGSASVIKKCLYDVTVKCEVVALYKEERMLKQNCREVY